MELHGTNRICLQGTDSKLSFIADRNFYHSLGNSPGFINAELRLFNYYLHANSFMQSSIFAMTKEIRRLKLSNCRIRDEVLLESLTMIYLALFAEFYINNYIVQLINVQQVPPLHK